MSTENSPFESAERRIDFDLELPEYMREELSRPFGPVFQETELSEYLSDCDQIIAVGDMVCATLVKRGIVPKMMIYDCRTERGPCDVSCEIMENAPGKSVTVDNTAGKLTAMLWNAVADSLESGNITKIRVVGEEDLASLAAIMLADTGDCVIYGIPNEGITVIRTDSEIKSQVKTLLERMRSGRLE